jgi:glycogen(starch) synthase
MAKRRDDKDKAHKSIQRKVAPKTKPAALKRPDTPEPPARASDAKPEPAKAASPASPPAQSPAAPPTETPHPQAATHATPTAQSTPQFPHAPTDISGSDAGIPSSAIPSAIQGTARASMSASEHPSRISDMPQRDYTPRTRSEPTPAPTEPGESTLVETSESLPLLFECGWEVCWQLGGIYTVLKTKAVSMMNRWGDRYFLIGPYNPQTAAVEFEEQPTDGYIRQTLDQLRAQGIPCHYGRWLIPGRPKVILLDYRARFSQMDSDRYYMWKDHGIGLQTGDGEVNEVVAFGFTVAEFFRNLCLFVKDRGIVAQFHEWMGGVAVPRIAHLRLPIATVFTTHATLLGRYIAADNPYFYQHLPFLDGEREAQHYNIYPRYQIEKAAAHASTVFTTVSEVTGVEAERLLGRKPDVIVPNGLNIQRFAALHEFQNLHRKYKEEIHEFVMGHFFPSYTFDLDNTVYMFTAGRYEYKNKGFDMFIEALHQLNWRLKNVPDRPNVVAFIITRAMTRGYNVAVLHNRTMFEELRDTCMDIKEQMGHNLFMGVARGRMPGAQEILTDDDSVRLKRVMHAYRTGRQPTIVTHEMVDDAGDPVLKHLRHRQLFNHPEDPVKVIFHPDFVSATSPLWRIDYEQFVRGCHLGVFPSYYEPWGYTPMECVAMGLPAITTDLSGFGAYVQRHIPNNADQGLLVVNRLNQSFEQATREMADYMFNFVQMTRRQRIELRNKVERLSELFDWSALSKHYKEAHDLALSRHGIAHPGTLEVRVI